ncbi:MAG: hypothetical protein KQ78_01859 [Candidatus Izimaplasma bacterium HR2]|nr:MAG: hypothetical protein KQ78_01859 [Candidatus Izimaplasma bacterium HR2]
MINFTPIIYFRLEGGHINIKELKKFLKRSFRRFLKTEKKYYIDQQVKNNLPLDYCEGFKIGDELGIIIELEVDGNISIKVIEHINLQ